MYISTGALIFGFLILWIIASKIDRVEKKQIEHEIDMESEPETIGEHWARMEQNNKK